MFSPHEALHVVELQLLQENVGFESILRNGMRLYVVTLRQGSELY